MSVTASLLKMFFGSKADKDRKAIQPYVDKILAVYPEIEKLTDDQLRDRVSGFRELIRERVREDEERIASLKARMEEAEVEIDEKEQIGTEIDRLKKHVNETIETVLDEILPEVFAIVKDTARRFTRNETITVSVTDADRELAAKGKDFVTIEGDKAVYKNRWLAGGNEIVWDMIHYDVQLFGGVALHKGNVAEMATGEGKTLVATLPVFLNALAGKGVHIVTVNDYLARRDSEWMGPIYEFHGLTVDCIDKHQPNSDARRDAYNCDITFGTNNEFGFDYLRDNMSIDPGDLVQRPHHFAIVDEVDSVLIDDARTPLIISGPVPRGEDQLFEEYRGQVESLYSLQRNLCTSLLAEAKKVAAEGDEQKAGRLLLCVHKGLPKYKPLIKFLSEPGMKALMQKTENFYMQDNSKRMHEVTDDLYFIIDEKLHSVELTDKGHDSLSGNVNDKRFFILPDIGSEIAALEKSDKTVEERLEAKDKLLNEYALKSERVHTVHQLLKAYALFEKDTEYVVMDNKVKIVDEQTGRILDGRRYSDGLHQAIEAKERVKVEAATQTFATITLQNYFRMYHKLAGMTGTAETEASELWNIYKLDVIVIPTNRKVVRKDFQDLIYKTKREKYAAVIDEIVRLVGEGRPVLVGTTSVEISELLSKMLKLRGIKHNVLNAKQHQLEAQIVAEAGRPGQVTIATNMAGRGTDIKLATEVKDAGGLAIIGTERHESRRVDRQLRGRAGRQGDPGSSQFFVSLEDDLMRLFGSERIARLMDSMGLKEGEVIQAGMMSRAIERAQRKVEENNFGIRKRLLEYDDVMNSQREVIYSRRHNAVFGERVEVDINNMMTDFAETFIENYRGLPFDEFKVELIRQISIEPSFTEEEYDDLKDPQLAQMLLGDMRSALKRRATQIAQQAFPVLESIYKEQGDKFENISIPLTDGKRGLNVPVNFKRAVDSKGLEIHKAFSRVMMLITIDDDWKEHLRDMDDLKQSVQNAAYEQKDPLLIYKFESFELFRKMIEKINREVLSMLLKVYLPVAPAESQAQAQPQQAVPQRNRPDMSRLQTSRNDGPVPPGVQRGGASAAGGSSANGGGKPMPAHAEKQVGRNDPCPCGSGKKYKNCHGAA